VNETKRQRRLRIKRSRRRNRAQQRTTDSQRKEWRKAPATNEQVQALRAIATENGRTFSVGVTQGDAWRRIQRARLLAEHARRDCAPPWTRRAPQRKARRGG
jgi:hypothetical protein